MKGMKYDVPSIARLVLFLATGFAYLGINVPVETQELVVTVIAGLVGLYTMYKNNYLFDRGIKQREVLKKEDLYDKNK